MFRVLPLIYWEKMRPTKILHEKLKQKSVYDCYGTLTIVNHLTDDKLIWLILKAGRTHATSGAVQQFYTGG